MPKYRTKINKSGKCGLKTRKIRGGAMSNNMNVKDKKGFVSIMKRFFHKNKQPQPKHPQTELKPPPKSILKKNKFVKPKNVPKIPSNTKQKKSANIRFANNEGFYLENTNPRIGYTPSPIVPIKLHSKNKNSQNTQLNEVFGFTHTNNPNNPNNADDEVFSGFNNEY